MKVKSLGLKKKKYIVEFEEVDESFTVSEEIILEYRLVKGKILEEESFNAFKESVRQDKYRQKLLYYTTYKPRTEKEASLYLDKFDVPQNAKFKYINHLKKTNILNDEVFAKNYIEEYSEFRLVGPSKIKFDLIKKGISEKIINKYLGHYNQELVEENIKKLAIKKLKSMKNKSMQKVMISLKTFITNKGYDYTDVKNELSKMKAYISSSIDEDEALHKAYERYLLKYKRSAKSQPFKNYIIPKLMQQGYTYQKILKLLEGVNNEY
ncbi:RecX family transcriptional regulator [Mycoplasmatota bacterium]|nr:RecX family transcriptional regulator [Mycoplasmatota bacterium]